MTCDFQQRGILTSADLDTHVQPLFNLRNQKWISYSRLILIEYQATRKGSDQTAHMRRLIWAFDGRTYYIVGNLMLRLIWKTTLKIHLDLSQTFKCAFNETLNGTCTGNSPKYLRSKLMSRVSEFYRNPALNWWHFLRWIDEHLRSIDQYRL